MFDRSLRSPQCTCFGDKVHQQFLMFNVIKDNNRFVALVSLEQSPTKCLVDYL